jgi:hypothetical protein
MILATCDGATHRQPQTGGSHNGFGTQSAEAARNSQNLLL